MLNILNKKKDINIYYIPVLMTVKNSFKLIHDIQLSPNIKYNIMPIIKKKFNLDEENIFILNNLISFKIISKQHNNIYKYIEDRVYKNNYLNYIDIFNNYGDEIGKSNLFLRFLPIGIKSQDSTNYKKISKINSILLAKYIREIIPISITTLYIDAYIINSSKIKKYISFIQNSFIELSI